MRKIAIEGREVRRENPVNKQISKASLKKSESKVLKKKKS